MKELKKCPFCGGNAIGYYLDTAQMYEIECSDCSRAQTIMETKERAIKSWNERDGELISKEDAVKIVRECINVPKSAWGESDYMLCIYRVIDKYFENLIK